MVSKASEPIDINTASAADLNRLGERFGKAIIAGRPYRSVDELVSKRVLKRSTFSRIKDRITVNTAAQPTAAPKASVVQSLTTNAHSETRRRQ
jgi:Helix-hairpin-helix motif